MRNDSQQIGSSGAKPLRAVPSGADSQRDESLGTGSSSGGRGREWALLGEWLGAAPSLLGEVELGVLRERLAFVGRARASLVALEAELVAEVARREGDAAAAELLRRDQKRSRAGARKAVRTAAQLEWAPNVARKLADGAITPEAAGLILDAAGEAPVDQNTLLDAAEAEPDDLFRRTVKDHINERTSEQALTARRERQYAKRRASISEQPDGMVHLFADLDPLAGARVRTALFAKADELFRRENPTQRSTPPQRLADALHQLLSTHTNHRHDSDGTAGDDGTAGGGVVDTSGAGGGDTNTSSGAGGGAGGGAVGGGGLSSGVELLVLADYDVVHDQLRHARLSDGTRLTEAETLAAACDAKILPGIFNKHTGNVVLGRSQRKVRPRLRKRLVARDRGCVGCGAHEQICEVHHIDHWAHGGATSYDNTCLLCWRCHHIRAHLHGEVVTRRADGSLSLAPPNHPPDKPPGQPGEHPPGRAGMYPPAPPEKHASGRAADRPQNHPREHASGRTADRPQNHPRKHASGRAADRPQNHPRKHASGRAADRPQNQPREHASGRAADRPQNQPRKYPPDHPSGHLPNHPREHPPDHPRRQPQDQQQNQPPGKPSAQPVLPGKPSAQPVLPGKPSAQPVPPGKHPGEEPGEPTGCESGGGHTVVAAGVAWGETNGTAAPVQLDGPPDGDRPRRDRGALGPTERADRTRFPEIMCRGAITTRQSVGRIGGT